nr:hypothetical protein [uncultured Rhodopila sp.]
MSGLAWFFFVSAGVMYFVTLAIRIEKIITLLCRIHNELVMANNPAVRFNPRDLKINIPLYRETHEPFQQDEAPR